MSIVVFVFGLPGSGKSTIARSIETMIQERDKGMSVFRMSDYEILYDWFRNSQKQEDFRPTKHGGFDVLNRHLYDEALKDLKGKVPENEACLKNEFAIIEFARCDYSESLKIFEGLLQRSHFLFLDAEIKTCMQRVEQRALDPRTLDDHFVSKYVFDLYKQHDQYLASNISKLKTCYGIENHRIKIIDNRDKTSMQNVLKQAEDFVDSLLKQEVRELQTV